MEKTHTYQQMGIMLKDNANEGQDLATHPKKSELIPIKKQTESPLFKTAYVKPESQVISQESLSNTKKKMVSPSSNSRFYKCPYSSCKKAYNKKKSLNFHNKNFHSEEILSSSKLNNVEKRQRINLQDFDQKSNVSDEFCAKKNKTEEDLLSKCSSPTNITSKYIALNKRSCLNQLDDGVLDTHVSSPESFFEHKWIKDSAESSPEKDNCKLQTPNDLGNQLTSLDKLTKGSRHIMIPKNMIVPQNDIENQGTKIVSPQCTREKMETLIPIAQESNDFEPSEPILNLATGNLSYQSQAKLVQEDMKLTEKKVRED